MLSKKIKSIALGIVVAIGLTVLTPISAFAFETKSSKVNQIHEIQVVNQPLQIAESKFPSQVLQPKQGWKKKAVVYALKYGGAFLGKIFEFIGDSKIASMLTEHAFEIGNFLDSIEDGIEARLIGFMADEIGLPMSAARVIAWAISQVLL